MSVEDEESDTILSLQDVLEEDQELENTANAVLGDSDDSQCSYSKVEALPKLTSITNLPEPLI